MALCNTTHRPCKPISHKILYEYGSQQEFCLATMADILMLIESHQITLLCCNDFGSIRFQHSIKQRCTVRLKYESAHIRSIRTDLLHSPDSPTVNTISSNDYDKSIARANESTRSFVHLISLSFVQQ